MRTAAARLLLVAVAGGLACCARPGEWVRGPADALSETHPTDGRWVDAAEATPAAGLPAPGSALDRADRAQAPEDGADALVLRLHGGGAGARAPEGLFRNTYYDFPVEGEGARDATIFDAECRPLAAVTTTFHDRVCVQGSGRLASGRTISFAKRGCACAAVCPRTGQKVCFERLDPALFPSGRGATGRAITPLLTVAVDSSVIPLGTALFIPELAGLPRPDGTRHDGCFLAEDRGIKVVGRQVDVFTGGPDVTARWNALVPSNQGVHVQLGDPRCAALAPARPAAR